MRLGFTWDEAREIVGSDAAATAESLRETTESNMDAEKYIAALESALTFARNFYFPLDADIRKAAIFALAMDVGYGLGAYDDAEIRRVVTSTYSRLVVRHTFDSVGPVVDAAEWAKQIRAGIRKRRGDT